MKIDDVRYVHFNAGLGHYGVPAAITGVVIDRTDPQPIGLCYRLRYDDGTDAVVSIADPTNQFVDNLGNIYPPSPARPPGPDKGASPPGHANGDVIAAARHIEATLADLRKPPLSRNELMERLRGIYEHAEPAQRQGNLRALSLLGLLIADLDDEPAPTEQPRSSEASPCDNGQGPDLTMFAVSLSQDLRRQARDAADPEMNPPSCRVSPILLTAAADYIDRLEADLALRGASPSCANDERPEKDRGPLPRPEVAINQSYWRP